MSNISSLVSGAGIKSLVKIQVPQPPRGDRAAPSQRSARSVLPQLQGEMQVGCWEGGHLFCRLAVGKEDMTAVTSCVSTETGILLVQSVLVEGKSTPRAPPYRCRRLGLRCGQCVWFAPQGVLTKLD